MIQLSLTWYLSLHQVQYLHTDEEIRGSYPKYSLVKYFNPTWLCFIRLYVIFISVNFNFFRNVYLINNIDVYSLINVVVVNQVITNAHNYHVIKCFGIISLSCRSDLTFLFYYFSDISEKRILITLQMYKLIVHSIQKYIKLSTFTMEKWNTIQDIFFYRQFITAITCVCHTI